MSNTKHSDTLTYIDTLGLDDLNTLADAIDAKISAILDEDKTDVWVFHSGVINEGFYRSNWDAEVALKEYVNSKEYRYTDKLSIFKIREKESEADRLINDY